MLYKNTFIATPTGTKKISTFIPGDLISTKEGVVHVLKNEKVDTSPLLRIRTEGCTILCSPDHEFLVFNEESKFYYFSPLTDTIKKLVKYTPLLLEVIPIMDWDVISSGEVYRLHLAEGHSLIINDQIIARNN